MKTKKKPDETRYKELRKKWGSKEGLTQKEFEEMREYEKEVNNGQAL